MREIIFRGKSVDDGKWKEGYFCPCCFGHFPCSPAIVSKDEIEKGCWRPEEVDPKTIGQYTGLKDKNGKRIFEGDILEVCMTGKVVIEFDDGIFGAHFEEYGLLPLRRSLFGEGGIIIGNIHDNPELLEV